VTGGGMLYGYAKYHINRQRFGEISRHDQAKFTPLSDHTSCD
jgi:hypothetical protein